MITFKLGKYPETVYQQSYTPPQPQYPWPYSGTGHRRVDHPHGRVVNETMDKLTYAKFISNLPFKPGDLVTYNTVETLTVWNVFLIDSVTEVHFMVTDWGNNRTGPKCIYYRSFDPVRKDWGPLISSGPLLYRKLKAGEIPPEPIQELMSSKC